MPSPRPRARVIPKRSIASIYMPSSYKKWKADVVALLRDQLGDPSPVEGRVAVWCVFAVQRPKTTKRVAPPGDVDNYAKSLLDALTEYGAWKDDIQVTLLTADKRWTRDGEDPHVPLRITEDDR